MNNKLYLPDCPELLAEWDDEKNTGLDATSITLRSNRRVWWKCSLGHSWKTSVWNRSSGTGCPFCSNRKILPGFNDVLTRYPFIGKYWDHEKNLPLEPSEIMPSYIGQQIWWKCDAGHSWHSFLTSFLNNPGCPYCDGRRKPERDVSLSHGYPEIAAEWDHTKNGSLSPDEVRAGSNLDVWWICPLGHSYRKRISRRVFQSSCPYCNGWSLLPGFNDLGTLYPDIAAEWDYEKNHPLTPRETYRATPRKVWWLCPNGHSYSATVSNRTGKIKQGCPYCKNRKVLTGFNDLETLFPAIAAEWDHEKNHPLLPSQVVGKSAKRVWWKCDKGHSWDAVIANRTSRITGCPYCSGLRVVTGENDFASLNPSLLKEWDYEKNCDVSPSELAAGSPFVAWWKCEKGHSWQSPLYSRTHGENCPFCQSVKPYYSRLI